MFIYSLGKDRAIAALHQRAARLEAEISSSDAYRRAFLADLPDFPRIFGLLGLKLKQIGSLAAGTVASGTVGVGFLVTAWIAGLALWWGTRAYQQAMA